MKRFRKQLSVSNYLRLVRHEFDGIKEHRQGSKHTISLTDALMSALAMFSLKYPSLLQFDAGRDDPVIKHNLKHLYGVNNVPCDTQMRALLDPIAPSDLHRAFNRIFTELQRGKVLEGYRFLDDHYLLSIDGTGHFASSSLHCDECCSKTSRNGHQLYYHQLLGAALVHPQQRCVIPFAPEAIIKGDGQNKNDCERNAAKRLLPRLRRHHPHLKLIVVEDGLASNGPHIRLLQELGCRYILGAKPGDHQALFKVFDACLTREEFEQSDEQGRQHGFRFANDLPLNETHPDIRVNLLEYWEVRKNKTLNFTWVTDITLHKDNVFAVMQGGRARWKIENETFNTLKNQGYHLEHNYGHGKQHLATVFGLLTMLAFLIDQAQELCCPLFQAARARYRSRLYLWKRLQSRFLELLISDWALLWRSIAEGQQVLPLTLDSG